MAPTESDESSDFRNIAVASFQMRTLVMPFLLLNNKMTSTSVLLRPTLQHLAGANNEQTCGLIVCKVYQA